MKIHGARRVLRGVAVVEDGHAPPCAIRNRHGTEKEEQAVSNSQSEHQESRSRFHLHTAAGGSSLDGLDAADHD